MKRKGKFGLECFSGMMGDGAGGPLMPGDLLGLPGVRLHVSSQRRGAHSWYGLQKRSSEGAGPGSIAFKTWPHRPHCTAFWQTFRKHLDLLGVRVAGIQLSTKQA